MNREQIVEAVTRRVENTTLTIDVDGETLALPVADAGARIDASSAADAVLEASNGLASALGAVLNIPAGDVPVDVAIDEEAFRSFAEKVDALTGEPPVPARVELADDGVSHRAVPARDGYGVDRDALREALLGASRETTSRLVSLQARPQASDITTEEAEKAAKDADALIARDVSISGPKDVYTADLAVRAKWVAVDAVEGSLEARIDEEAVKAWVDETIASADRKPINAINDVDASGTFLQAARPSKPGIEVTNGDAVKRELVDALKSSSAYAGEFEWKEIPAGTEERVVPSGPERFAYRARPGEKWIDVNLTDSTLTAYQGTELVRGPVLINHGGVGHETVTGTYRVYLKYAAQDMGCTPDWPYCERQVPWVAYWYKDYALHGAPWVKEFGIGTDESSHGCINIPVEEARWVHDFVEIGTTVVTHY